MTAGRDFKFLLAQALGKTLWQLFDGPERLDPDEYQQWKDHHRRQPLWPVRGDLNAGQVARAVYAVGRYRPVPKCEDFVLTMRKAKTPSVEHNAEQLNVLAQLMGTKFTPAPGK